MSLVAAKKAAIASIAAEIRPLAEKSKTADLSAEESAKFDDLVTQLNAAGEDLVKAENREAQAEAALKADEQFNRPAQKGGPERSLVNDQPEQAKSIGQRFVESSEFKNRRGNDVMSDPFKTGSILHEKALIYSGTPSASMLMPQVVPTIFRANEKVSGIRQALAAGRTSSDVITILQESGFTNSAAEVAEATAVNEGAKPESALTFTEVSFNVRTIAHWIPITRQMLEDMPQMESYVEGRLRDGLERRVANQLLNGDGSAPNLRGILQTSGITTANAAYFLANPVKDTGADNENLNRIRRAKRLVRTTAGATPTFIIANPADVETWDTLSSTTGEYLFEGPTSAASVGRLWGLPVYEDEYITVGTALVGDGAMAAVYDRMDAAIYTTDSHSDFFIRNLFVLLAEVRLALVVYRPAAFVAVSLA